MRKTRIIATLGPSSATPDGVPALIAAGVDIFRLNFSHGSHEQHAASVALVREAAAAAARQVAILQDLSGPKIRTGRLASGQPIPLPAGSRLRITTGDEEGCEGHVYTTFAGLAHSVSPGMRLLLDDGALELRVEATDGTSIDTTVVVGGTLAQHKGINAPDVALPASALTDKDIADLRFGASLGVDMVALSFVQTVEDLLSTRAELRAAGAEATTLIAKIERPQAVANLGELLGACDGVMVARGDLGNEVPLHSVPRAQKVITQLAQRAGVPVIVATQVLESMRTNPRPTRAEVSDAANAADDSVDAIMLSGETASGLYPVAAVKLLDAVIRDAESLNPKPRAAFNAGVLGVPHNRALCEAAVTLAHAGKAEAIVAVTREGKTARVLAALRPEIPIHAVTSDPRVARRLMLHRGIEPIAIEKSVLDSAGGIEVERHLVELGVLRAGEPIVFVSVNADLTRPDANFLRIRRVG
ncbi:Pyruvate kinase [Luteitalea pratensis]|uniref:Pyruvate kinase n=1 Tax=Luteitalea pratensis TaxID=1855912 RepID=A0A143PWK9_LUTPR|nr:pyruvate kinase [Luteitalea pratensis]AMY12450.1 Pyruvate kinase [Luteitalea pratensis]